jgi:glucose/arabinose dehydrogenase
MKIVFATALCLLIALSAQTRTQTETAARQAAQPKPADEKPDARPFKLTPHRVSLDRRRVFNLNLPEGYEITVAVTGLRRVRFMALSPDNRVFVTDMFNLADNIKGAVFILDQFDPAQGRFQTVKPYLTGLHNPNSIAFLTDKKKIDWLYIALTDKLIRYRYTRGETSPTSAAETIATFPDYGLSYKYGGWHLTRTISPGPNGKLYVSVGSSCNACEEKEEVRATILEIDPDGQNQRIYASGLRNAVGLKWAGRELYATVMAVDHLGDDKPADTMYQVKDGANYGWPHCYQSRSKIGHDPYLNHWSKKRLCIDVPLAFAEFAAHASPLGLEYFDRTVSDPRLKNSFLVALHGSSTPGLGRGYRIARVGRGASVRDFITGFIQGRRVAGRPVDILRFGTDAFLITDDKAGAVYYVARKKETANK